MSDYKLEDKYISFNGITLGSDQIECAEYMLARKDAYWVVSVVLVKTLITSVANKVLLDKYSTVLSIDSLSC